ncbi:hypothetical protein LBO01_28030 [Companilactobacillus paralimentarius]|nr:hypothetical protein LBO01_28030 [Companilactobacillus paralimentarius]
MLFFFNNKKTYFQSAFVKLLFILIIEKIHFLKIHFLKIHFHIFENVIKARLWYMKIKKK